MADTKQERVWAQEYPNEDTHGSILLAWVVMHWDLFKSDDRLEDVRILEMSKGWRGLIRLARAQWDKHQTGLSFDGMKRLVWDAKALDIKVKERLVDLVAWSEDISDKVTEEDYEEAMTKVWEATRKDVFAKGMTTATKQMFFSDLDVGLDDALNTINKVRTMARGKTAGIATMADMGADIEKNYERSMGVPISTGFVPLDVATLGGIRKGHEWLVCGYASQGKSYLSREISFRYAVEGHHVYYVSLEMGKVDTAEYLVARMAHNIKAGGIPVGNAVKRTLHDEDKEVYLQAARRWAAPDGPGQNLSLWVPDDEVTADDVWRQAEIEHHRRPIDLLVVDYSELLAPMSRRDDYRIRLGETIRIFKRLAMGLGRGDGTRVILLHQTSRKGYEAACKRGYYVKQELAETSQAERHPDVILWILQTEAMMADRECKIGTAKNRTGPVSALSNGYSVYSDFDQGIITDLVPDPPNLPF